MWGTNVQKRYLLTSHRPLGPPKVPTITPTLQLGRVVSDITLSSPVHTSNTTPWVLECGLEAPDKPRSTHRARALTPQGGSTKLNHIVGKWPWSICTAVSPPATSRARTTVRLMLECPRLHTTTCGLGQARPCKVEAMARRLTAEAGMIMPTYDSDGTFLPKVSGVLLLRMSLHWRLCATAL